MKRPLFTIGDTLRVTNRKPEYELIFEVDTVSINQVGDFVYSGPEVDKGVGRATAYSENVLERYVPKKEYWLWATKTGDVITHYMDDNFRGPYGRNGDCYKELGMVKLHWSIMEFEDRHEIAKKSVDLKFDPNYFTDTHNIFPTQIDTLDEAPPILPPANRAPPATKGPVPRVSKGFFDNFLKELN